MHSVVGRRAVILAAAGLLLPACSADPSAPIPSGSTPGSVPGHDIVPAAASAQASPSAATSTNAPVRTVLSRRSAVEAFGDRQPTVFGLDLPGVISRLPQGTRGVALTFDCCGGPGGDALDHALVAALRGNRVPATFFLNASWVETNPGLAQDLADDPLFEIASHGNRHLPLSVAGQAAYGIPGTRNAAEVYDEIMVSQEVLFRRTGKTVRYFRSGTAHLDDVSAQMVRALGLLPVNFSVNGDAGATFDAPTVAAQFNTAQNGDIVIAHANRPLSGTAGGTAAALPAMLERGVRFVRLGEALPG